MQRRAFEEVELDMVRERADGHHIPFGGPHRGVPFPFLDHVGVGVEDQGAQSSQQRAAPISQAGDVGGEALGGIHTSCWPCFFHDSLLLVLYRQKGNRDRSACASLRSTITTASFFMSLASGPSAIG